jgi:GTPase SAR1 family protein
MQNSLKYKIVFLGDASVGKTSLVQYIINGSAQTTYQVLDLFIYSQLSAYNQLKK